MLLLKTKVLVIAMVALAAASLLLSILILPTPEVAAQSVGDPVTMSGPTCDAGVLVDGVCEIREPAPTTCPDGFEPDVSLGGICARFEAADQQPPSCPAGSHGEPGGCYILVAKGPIQGTCEEGEPAGNVCLIVGDPPEPGADTCPISATVLEVDGRCFTLISQQAGGGCPIGTTLADDEISCERRVELVTGTAVCASGFGLVDGECIRHEPQIPGVPECPVGSVEDADENCRKPVEDALGTYFCADPNAALNGGSCVFTAGFVVGACPDGFEFDGSDCVQFGDPVVTYYCDGHEVTINMSLGDRGVGTAGDDVILGTSGSDIISGRGGADVICSVDGDDFVRGGAGADVIFGGAGADLVFGGAGGDIIFGGVGKDALRGNLGPDMLHGDAGRDVLTGGPGADILDGGEDIDRCRGGADIDTATAACELLADIP